MIRQYLSSWSTPKGGKLLLVFYPISVDQEIKILWYGKKEKEWDRPPIYLGEVGFVVSNKLSLETSPPENAEKFALHINGVIEEDTFR